MKKIINLTQDIVKIMFTNHLFAYSAMGAYFVLMSTIPFLMLLFSLIQYLPVSSTEITLMLTSIVPSRYSPAVIDFINEVNKISFAAVPITAITAIWAASKGLGALVKGLNVIHQVTETRNYFQLKFKAIFDTILFMLGLLFSLLILVFGEKISNWLVAQLEWLSFYTDYFMSIRLVLAIIILTVIFWLFYCYLPNKKLHELKQLPGALFTTFCWIGFSIIFAQIFNTSGNYSIIYGSMASLILVMIWLYTCMILFYIGAAINIVLSTYIK